MVNVDTINIQKFFLWALYIEITSNTNTYLKTLFVPMGY